MAQHACCSETLGNPDNPMIPPMTSGSQRRFLPRTLTATLLSTLLTMSLLPANTAAADVPAYRNPKLPLEQRIDDLMGRMSVEEKVGQLVQLPGNGLATPEACRTGQIGSVLSAIGMDAAPFQKAALESRLGIPLVMGIDAVHGHTMWHDATVFPSQLGMSCAWEEDLCRRIARVTAEEMSENGVQWTFSPILCLPRDLRWGRTGESFGEDTTLISRLGVAMIKGYQGDDLSDPRSVAACAKHYAGYGESDGGRDASESWHSPRTMRAVFFPPFEAAAKAGCATFMSAYHAIDGVPVAFNRWMLTDVLRGEWGWNGLMVTDWDIIGRMHRDRKLAPTWAEGAARGLQAGNDLVMTTPSFYESTLANLKTGRVKQAEVDEACRRVLRLKFRLGLFENPRLPNPEAMAKICAAPAHRELALEAARKSLVLAKNRGLLPLKRERGMKIAVIGPNAADWLAMTGDWSLAAGQNQGERDAYPEGRIVTVLQGLRKVAGPDISISHAVGCGIEAIAWDGYPPKWSRLPQGDGRREAMPEKIAGAVDAARAADLAVLVLGDHVHTYVGESKSTATLTLPEGQQELFDAVLATGRPVVVVLATSKPLAVPEIAARADAIIIAHNPGMEGGTAIAEAIFGDIEPSGRLTLSWPHHVGQCPVRYDQSIGSHQAGYPDLPGVKYDPVFAFGFGLSYTTVKYRGLKLEKAKLGAGEPVRASIIVRNTGNRPVVETVQAYLHDNYTSVVWADRKLKTWARVELKPAEEKVVTLEIPHADLALCDAAGKWVVEPGDFELQVGSSSRTADLQKVSFTVE